MINFSGHFAGEDGRIYVGITHDFDHQRCRSNSFFHDESYETIKASKAEVQGVIFGLLGETGLAQYGSGKYVKVEGKRKNIETFTGLKLKNFKNFTIYLATKLNK